MPEDMLPSTEVNLPYWLVNVPRDQWPTNCPDFLKNASERDKKILCTPDSQSHRLTWEEVREIIKTNRLDQFTRVPSELRRYLAYIADLKTRYGSVMNFILDKRLQWKRNYSSTDSAPFRNPDTDDIKILYNDWPYAIDERIVHLVVWIKFDLEVDPSADELAPAVRKEIDGYVDRTFRARASNDSVIWFKNWKSLKSVHAVEHFHVMLYDPSRDFIRQITNNDIPAIQIVQLNEQKES